MLVMRGGQAPPCAGEPTESPEDFCPLQRVWHHASRMPTGPVTSAGSTLCGCTHLPDAIQARQHNTRNSSRELFQVPRWRTRATSGKQSIHTMLTPRKRGRTLRSRWARGARDNIHPKTNERIRGWILTYSMALCLYSEAALTGGLLRTADAAHPDLNRIHTYLRDNCIKVVIATNKSGDEEERVPRNEWRGTLWAILLKHQPR